MRIIFLDIDGVLNSNRHYTDFYLKHDRPARSSVTNPEEQIDERNMKLLNELAIRSEANIVISSTWRMGRKQADLRNDLYKCGLDKSIKIIGVTPDYNLDRPRGEEIQEWMDNTNKNIEAFVILDDSSDMAHLMNYLVRTNLTVGLTKQDVEKALKILDVE
jgi:hypothetical protein